MKTKPSKSKTRLPTRGDGGNRRKITAFRFLDFKDAKLHPMTEDLVFTGYRACMVQQRARVGKHVTSVEIVPNVFVHYDRKGVYAVEVL